MRVYRTATPSPSPSPAFRPSREDRARARFTGCGEASSISPLRPSSTSLWPVNHKMVDVTVDYEAVDTADPAPSCALTVSSNEPVNGTGEGDTAPDWEIVDAHRVRLRAERAGTGDGRIYTITAACRDASGNFAQELATVTVAR